MTEKPSHRLVALAYDGLCTFEFGLAVEVFGLPRPEFDFPWYDFAVAAVEPGSLRAAGGIRIEVDGDLDLLERADTVVAPGWRGAEEPVPERLVEALRRAQARGARLVSLCSGVFVLAATGLLDEHRATTHWRYVESLTRRFPRIRVEPDVLYVDDDGARPGALLTAAGSAAGLDLCLHIVRRDHGPAVANAVARRLVIAPHREGGQGQFIQSPMASASGQDGGARLSALLDWLARQADLPLGAKPLRVEALAARAGMSPRSFARHFKLVTGLSPHDWLLRQRVRHAQELLEDSDLPVERIAEASGFGAPETLRHHFRRIAGTTPSAYRRAFGLKRGISEVAGSEQATTD